MAWEVDKKKWLATGSGIAMGTLGAYTGWQFWREHQKLLTDLVGNSQAIEIPNGRIEYTDHGEGAAILVSHGRMGGYDQGLAIAGLFNRQAYRFITPSRAGYLRSTLDTGWTPEAQADSFAQLLDELNISRVAQIGLSSGAPAAIEFALRFPERCQALVLISAITRKPSPARQLMNTLAQVQDFCMRFDLPGWLLWRSGLKVLMVMDGADPRLAAEAVQEPAKLHALQQYYQALASASLRLKGAKNDDRQIQRLTKFPFQKIQTPTLIVHCPNDPQSFFPQAALTAREIPGAELLKLKNGGHICFIMRKEQFVPEVSQFLNHQVLQGS